MPRSIALERSTSWFLRYWPHLTHCVPARKNFIIFKARRAQQLFSGVETAVHKPSYRQLYAREKALVENNRQSIQQLLTCLRYAIVKQLTFPPRDLFPSKTSQSHLKMAWWFRAFRCIFDRDSSPKAYFDDTYIKRV